LREIGPCVTLFRFIFLPCADFDGGEPRANMVAGFGAPAPKLGIDRKGMYWIGWPVRLCDGGESD
jgi:hypothetical protein